MKRLSLFLFVFTLFVYTTKAQTFATNTGKASVTSATYNNIKASNNAVKAKLYLSGEKAGKIVVSMDIQGFQFKSGTMRQHFNKDMNSAKYPSAKFVGTITGYSKLKKSGTYTLKTTGKLTMRGVTKTKTFTLSLTVKNGEIVGNTSFPVALADFKYGAKEGGKTYDTRGGFKKKDPKPTVKINLTLKKK